MKQSSLEQWTTVQLTLNDGTTIVKGALIELNNVGVVLTPDGASSIDEFYPYSAFIKMEKLG